MAGARAARARLTRIAQGPIGYQGDEVRGTQGSLGLQGMDVVGSQGILGDEGKRGAQGDATNGAQGVQGPQGIAFQGWEGPQGPQGTSFVGPQGYPGPNVVIPFNMTSGSAAGSSNSFVLLVNYLLPPGKYLFIFDAVLTATVSGVYTFQGETESQVSILAPNDSVPGHLLYYYENIVPRNYNIYLYSLLGGSPFATITWNLIILTF